MPSTSPVLLFNGAAQLLDLLAKLLEPDRSIMHAAVRAGDSMIWPINYPAWRSYWVETRRRL
jgi:hypothetical protein